MADLIEKYFKQDLTEAERKALGDELASSEDGAGKFAEKAEEAYRRYGLPEPQWKGPDDFRRRREIRSWYWLLPAFLLLGLAGFSIWTYLHRNNFIDESSV